MLSPYVRAALIALAFLASMVATYSLAADFLKSSPQLTEAEVGDMAHSDEFAVIVVPDENRLRLLVEYFGTSAPVERARIEIHDGKQSAAATELGDGVYASDAPWLLVAGKKALAFTIEAQDQHDVVVMVLNPDLAPAAAQRSTKYGPRPAQP